MSQRFGFFHDVFFYITVWGLCILFKLVSLSKMLPKQRKQDANSVWTSDQQLLQVVLSEVLNTSFAQLVCLKKALTSDSLPDN